MSEWRSGICTKVTVHTKPSSRPWIILEAQVRGNGEPPEDKTWDPCKTVYALFCCYIIISPAPIHLFLLLLFCFVF